MRVGARFVNQRLAAVPMEPSAALAKPDPDDAAASSSTRPARARTPTRATICASTGIEEEKLRVVSTATGGGFGARIACYPEQIVVVALARELGKAVRYIETRSETMLEMQHGRAQVQDVEIGGTRDGKVTGLKVRVIADCGAYPADAALMPMLTGLMSSGVYTIPKVDFHFDAVVTNTTPIGAYRGAGPPGGDRAGRARDRHVRGRDRDGPGRGPAQELHRPSSRTRRSRAPTTTRASTTRRWRSAWPTRATTSCAPSRRRGATAATSSSSGSGSAPTSSGPGSAPSSAPARCDEDGTVAVTAGTSSHGQGHETAYAQLVAGTLGIPLADVKVIQSDTKLVKRGMGTMGSRSLQVGGTRGPARDRRGAREGQAARRAPARGRRGRHRGRPRAGPRRRRARPPRAIPWAQLAAAAKDPSRAPEGFEGGLAGENDFETPDATYPFGTHLAVVEVDTETGLAHLVRHITVDDSGRIHNEMLLEGQVHGGIAQGVAQALFEEIAFDEDGNNVTGSLASYAIPSAGDLPTFETERTQTPTPRNPLGAKGVGESGAIGSTPAVWNAVVDALAAVRRAQHRHARHAAARLAGDQRRRLIASSAPVRASMSPIVVPSPMLARTAPGSSGSRPWRSSCVQPRAPRPRARSAGA